MEPRSDVHVRPPASACERARLPALPELSVAFRPLRGPCPELLAVLDPAVSLADSSSSVTQGSDALWAESPATAE